MFRNYFVTAFRYLWKQKGFSVINLIGLTVGLSVCYFALTFVSFELSHDRYHEKSERIYRLVTDVKTPNGIDYLSTTAPMASAMEAAFPEVQAATRIFLDHLIIQKDQEQYADEKIAYADSSLFSVFSFPLISGNPDNILKAPYSIVLSETSARKYFGDENPVGGILLVNGKERAQVTGVMKDIPHNSHFRVDMLLSMSTLGEEWMRNSKRFFFYTYLLLPENYDASKLSAKLPDFVKTHIDQKLGEYSLAIEPLKSVYLNAKPRGSKAGTSVTGNRSHVYIFSFVAAFVLFIACFNFINLTTALSIQRVKEIGVRKVLGTTRKLLIFQFLVESVSLTLIAFFASILVCSLLIPLFNDLTGKIINAGIFENINYLFVLFSAAVFIGLLSGIYPAFFLSRFQPVSSLKGGFVSATQGVNFRKVLVTAQFSISIILIVATIVVYRQLHFMQNQALGFKKDHNLVIDFQYDDNIISHQESVKDKLTKIPGVTMASISSSIPGRPNHLFPTQIENVANEMQEFQSDTYFVDYDFIKQYGISVLAGRMFSKDFGNDLKEAILINETAVKSLGFSNPKDVIGKRFSQLNVNGFVIGVIKDFHFRSFQEKVQPMTLRVAPGFFTFLTLNISGENTPESIANLERAWKSLIPDMPLIYFFADEAYDNQYRDEQRFGKLFICFASFAIIISCLGLLGLSAFSITQRTKEIGIRKVVGASTVSIVGLLSVDFIKLVLLAILIAVPVAWYAMDQWLRDFAYRIAIPLWSFALAGVIAVFIALGTVSFQAIKAALKNPVKSLRS
ncbi:putative ABC transport system permease protein [Dyadobacter koreensis]|uniref:Putative ABC transport system permease protein n=1 Tax=Dyadobacter koreensis TaxID=408657 RepID=A0A1H6TNN3_9BACT|nr:ABC transporter permease [Dyadobacter koreensis]SEI81699.1 putative ABC transport system permease protein [Dyadobacter koreensis]